MLGMHDIISTTSESAENIIIVKRIMPICVLLCACNKYLTCSRSARDKITCGHSWGELLHVWCDYTVFDCFVNARTDQMKSRIQKYLEVTFCFCINKAVYDVITSHKHDTCKLNNRICSSHVGEHDQKRFVLMPY